MRLSIEHFLQGKGVLINTPETTDPKTLVEYTCDNCKKRHMARLQFLQGLGEDEFCLKKHTLKNVAGLLGEEVIEVTLKDGTQVELDDLQCVLTLKAKITYLCSECEEQHESDLSGIRRRCTRQLSGECKSAICIGTKTIPTRERHTCKSLAPKFEEKHAKLTTDVEGVIGLDQEVSWSCTECASEYKILLVTMTRRINGEFEYLCIPCERQYHPDNMTLAKRTGKDAKKTKNQPLSHGELTQRFANKNRTLLTTYHEFVKLLSDNKGKKLGRERLPVLSACSDCGHEEELSLAGLGQRTFSCLECARVHHIPNTKYRWTTDSFIEVASVVHNNYYDYSKVVHISTDKYVSIGCPVHGFFPQQPCSHLQGHGCNKCVNREKKPTLSVKQIIHEFEKKGYECALDTHTKVGECSPYKYPYYCGCVNDNGSPKVSYITIPNLRKNTTGCSDCAIRARTTPVEEVQMYFQSQMCEPELSEYKNELTPISYTCSCGRPGCTTYKAFKKGIRCDWCADRKREHTNTLRYRAKNVFGSEMGREKIRQYYAKIKPGASHSSHIPAIVNKRKETNMKNHGVPSNLCLPEIRKLAEEALIKATGTKYPLEKPEYRQKGMNTTKERYGEFFYVLTQEYTEQMVEKYGLGYFVQSDEYKRQMVAKYGRIDFINSPLFQQEMIEKYGSEYYLQSHHFEEQMVAKYGRKDFINSPIFQEEMIAKYGAKFFIQSKQFKKIMVERYGVEHAAQNPEIFKKMLKTAFKRNKTFIFPSGRVEQMMGYECYALADLLKSGVSEDEIFVQLDDVPIIHYLDSQTDTQRVYYPDIYVTGQNFIIEVKSTYTYKKYKQRNIDKWIETSKSYSFEAWIYDRVKGGKILRVKKLVYVDGVKTEKTKYDLGDVSDPCG
jgi:hypothetical protein